MSEDVKNPMPSDPKEILALAKEKGVELTEGSSSPSPAATGT